MLIYIIREWVNHYIFDYFYIYVRILLVVLLNIMIIISIHVYHNNNKHTQYNPTVKHIIYVYNKLGRATGQIYPPFFIRDEKEINAYTTSNNITIFSGMLNFAKNDDELALILGHELSHYILKHVELSGGNKDDLMLQSYEFELNADKMGAFLALQAGYDVCNGRFIWQRLINTQGDIVENSGHPTNVFRFNNLKMPWCK